MSITDIITRQFNIANDEQYDLGLPKQKIYAMCNLRGVLYFMKGSDA